MTHKVARVEFGGGSAQQAQQKRVRVGYKHHQDSKYRDYKPDFAALARQYPDGFGPLYVLHCLLVPFFCSPCVCVLLILSGAYFSPLHPASCSSQTVLLPTLPNPSTLLSVTYLDAEKTDAVVDWEDPKAARALTRTLLQHDFQLEWDIPLERLCPPVPNRLNYICWVEDLLRLGRTSIADADADNKGMVRGLDVGTGASAIYPLLGCKVYNWNFLATDIDSAALEAAWANVLRNKLEDRIKLKLVPRINYSTDVFSKTTAVAAVAAAPLGPIRMALEGEDEKATQLDFVMCNPPFFGSLEEIHAGSADKDGSSDISSSNEGPLAAPQTPHGCVDEVITPGGELSFVTAMVRDSLVLREKVEWYTSMVGKKSSLRKLLGVLREAE
eukprot:evm.model.NODE_25191_length_8596_cov_20.292229.1